MLSTFTKEQLSGAGETALSDELERGRIVVFPECPLEVPSPEDQEFLRGEMPKHLNYKNISFHPEADKVSGIRGSRDVVQRTYRILREHSRRVQEFLARAIPTLASGWHAGTTSFRPLQERGRSLEAHASNELVHVDAGAYGATHGDRILRFFVNVNPVEDRVWLTKGPFREVYRRFGKEAGVSRPEGAQSYLEETFLDRLRTGTLRVLSHVNSQAKLLDSSPYDRAMRRFHNYMKDTPSFQASAEGHQEIRFKPFSAWMVFTDSVSHACTAGQYCLVDTFIVPLKNCRHLDEAPINILKGR